VRASVKHRAHKLLAEQQAKGKIWTGSFKELWRQIQRADWELAQQLMGDAIAAKMLYSLRRA